MPAVVLKSPNDKDSNKQGREIEHDSQEKIPKGVARKMWRAPTPLFLCIPSRRGKVRRGDGKALAPCEINYLNHDMPKGGSAAGFLL